MKTKGINTMLSGLLVILGSLFWLCSSLEKVDGRNIHCLYSNTWDCQIAMSFIGAMGKTPYNYLFFWLGVLVIGAGFVMVMSSKEETNVHSNT
jgi:hypothetical protein